MTGFLAYLKRGNELEKLRAENKRLQEINDEYESKLSRLVSRLTGGLLSRPYEIEDILEAADQYMEREKGKKYE